MVYGAWRASRFSNCLTHRHLTVSVGWRPECLGKPGWWMLNRQGDTLKQS